MRILKQRNHRQNQYRHPKDFFTKLHRAEKHDMEIEDYYSEDKLYMFSSEKEPSKTILKVEKENEFLPRAETSTIRPGGSIVWNINGPKGAKFKTKLTFMGQGGHNHGIGNSTANAVGTINPIQGTLVGNYPQNFKQIYRAGQFCGIIKDETTIGNKTMTRLITVALGNLKPLTQSKGIVLVGSTSSHPSNHWGTTKLVASIKKLGAEFYSKFKKPIYVNDMSLVTGGAFDIKGNFRAPHATHKDGRHVDMNWSSMTPEQREWFKEKAKEVGFTSVELHPNPNHWHLRV